MSFTSKYKLPYTLLFWVVNKKDPNPGIAIIRWDGTSAEVIESSSKGHLIKFAGKQCYVKSDGVENPLIQCMIMGNGKLERGGFGLITIGQFNNQSPHINNWFQAVEFNAPGPVGEVKFPENPSPLPGLLDHLKAVPLLIGAFDGFLKEEKREIMGENWLCSSYKDIHQGVIGAQGGIMPRALFYWQMEHPRVSDQWLFAQLDCHFSILGLDRRFPSTREGLIKMATHIVMAIVTPVGLYNYQRDRVVMQGGGQLEYEHFSKTIALHFQTGDCEDFAWVNAALLNRLQRRATVPVVTDLTGEEVEFLNTCTRVMDFYMVTNCLCQATAPELSNEMAQGILQIHEAPFTYKYAKELAGKMGAWHMTCILYPKKEFFRMVGKKPVFRRENEIYKNWDLPRLYGEGTTLIYPNPDENLEDQLPEILDLVMGKDKDETCSVCPAADNLQEDTCIYGNVLEVMTDYFVTHGQEPFSTMFIMGTKEVAGVPDSSFRDSKDQFILKPLGNLRGVDTTILEQECPFPIFHREMRDYRQQKLVMMKHKFSSMFGWYYTTKNTGIPYAALPGIFMRPVEPRKR